jgi:uncharacterized coiled-coil protein SlyX
MAEVDESRIETAIETMSKQFEGYHETQIGIFERLDAHRAVQDEVLKRLDKQITQNAERIRQNEIVIGNIDKRLVRLEATVERIDNTVKELRIYVDDRFDKVDARFDAMVLRTDDRFDKVDARFDAMVLRTDNRFDALATRIYWSAGIVTACLTIMLAIMTYILKVL